MKTTKRTRADWLALAAEWEESGLTQQRFCAGRGLKLGTFTYWRMRYLRAEAAQADAESGPGFVQLEPSRETRGIGLRLGGSWVRLDADAEFVAEVLVKLASRC